MSELETSADAWMYTDRVFPTAPVARQSDRYYVFDRGGAEADRLRELGTMIERLLKLVSYKPNAQLELLWRTGGPTLVIRLEVEDSYRRGDRIRVEHPYPVPAWLHPEADAVLAWVRDCIHRTECHEADEWLQVDGRRPFDPHRGDDGGV